MAAGVSSVSSLIYDRTCPDHSYLKTLCWKATVIAFATICTSLAAKALKGRADISLQAAAKFGSIEFVFAAIIAKITQETPFQRHRYYTTNIQAWRLEGIDHAVLVKEFYEADLPAISLFELSLRRHDFLDSPEQIFANLDSYSAPQLSWNRELLATKNIDPDQYENYLRFMMRCQECGIEVLRWQMNQPAQSILEKNPRYCDMLHQEFLKVPIYRFYCDVNFEDLLQSKTPLPTLADTVDTLSAYKVKTMDPSLLQMWYEVFIKNPDQWEHLDASIQTAFIKRFFEYLFSTPNKVFTDSPGDLSWINTLSENNLCDLSFPQIWWMSDWLKNPQATKDLTPETLATVKAKYQL